MSTLVELVLESPESDRVRKIEQEIDALVYKLYELTDTEIALIKQAYWEDGMDV